ncbi:hypothetical protein ACVQMG_000491 [Enterobacter roggenkampii]
MKALLITAMVIPFFLASCSWDPTGGKAQQELMDHHKAEKAEYDKRVEEDKNARLKKQQEDKAHFELTHPEVEVKKIDIGSGNSAENKLASAINNLQFVTRHPEKQTPDNIYVRVGVYNLTARALQRSLSGYAEECKRVSAYNNADYKNLCVANLAASLNDFSAMIKNKDIPDKTKIAALHEATYGGYIDFEHAARLASMHTKLCIQQGNVGYVHMVTIAAPCGR